MSLWYVFIPIGWLAFALWSRWVLDNPRGEVDAGIMWRTVRMYARHMQHLRVTGREHCPRSMHPGALVVVLNHTSGVDPVLAIAACPFEIRWIMASDMRYPLAEGFWQFGRVIFVDRKKRDASGTREAIHHVSEGGVLGIFPEGGIEEPPEKLMPFHPGVGLIVRKTGAPVLPIVLSGLKHTSTVGASFWKRGHAVLEFKPIMRFDESQSAADIAAELQRKYVEWTGWEVGKAKE